MISRAITWKMMMTEPMQQSLIDDDLELELPIPVGYRILVAMPDVEETFGDSGIIKSSKEIHLDTVMSTIGLVLDVGEEAYSDKDRCPSGPWCKQGDYVMFRDNTGTRFTVNGLEYRLMNDDSIEAVIDDPAGIQRAT